MKNYEGMPTQAEIKRRRIADYESRSIPINNGGKYKYLDGSTRLMNDAMVVGILASLIMRICLLFYNPI
ncbi:hypothetical protein Nepgr_009754 [Nepenthes gracilis]|uniref:Uncharacterized protein n=1 Tax=Nepenthes gracilis TaxID=150966 RepID=A0AAD3SBW5_NEPGR|nr:hypothetical protein Nepgr_009754 [Nepenthes gracilis]